MTDWLLFAACLLHATYLLCRSIPDVIADFRRRCRITREIFHCPLCDDDASPSDSETVCDEHEWQLELLDDSKGSYDEYIDWAYGYEEDPTFHE